MKPLLALVCVVTAALAASLATAWSTSSSPVPGGHDAATAEALDELRTTLASLERRLAALERAPVAAVERSHAVAPAPAPLSAPQSAAAEQRGSYWYLEQYVLSFATDAQGSEYFRLAVDAYVVELVSPIAALVRDADRPVALRIALANMLGKRRFDDSNEAIEALLAAVRPPSPDNLALRALAALTRIGSAAALPGLEALLPTLREQAVREAALALLVELSGDAANNALLRLFLRAPDDAMRLSVLRLLNGAEMQAALELLRAASTLGPIVRLDAARKVGEYDEPSFDAFVAQWRQVETDAQVIAALGGSQQKELRGWSAKKACGPPDADPRRDDPNAWASKNPDMGLVWLQLTYATPMRANGVRVFEVNSPGACAEVLARNPDGSWTTLWRGQADGGGQPLLIQFPLTQHAITTIRLVLDTKRKPGWNEIDAVELLGPGASQWASRASASSTYTGGGEDEVSANQRQHRAMVEILDSQARSRR
ncbi:MAG TPA: hypothetical protein VF384_13570 [Planctomycetota bacterium]